jgi:spore maturation protein CgeB
VAIRGFKVRIAYIGPERGTSLHRARALQRLGHQISIIDPWSWLGRSKWVSRWLFNAGGLGVGLFINQRLYREVSQAAPNLIWVNQGESLGPYILQRLRTIDVPIINHINDDPFGGRDKRRFSHFRKAIAFYDLIVVPRNVNVCEAKQAGARHVIRMMMSADEIAHAPRKLNSEEQHLFSSEVAFIGTWMPERGHFMVELIHRGVPLSIWGNQWHKAPEWPVIKSCWRGPGQYDDQAYSAVILAAKICLGFLSKGNRDLHTSRSLEIPALGSLLCAERTSEHLALYEEGVEAVFWNDAFECAEICKNLLANNKRRKEIAQKGHERALHNNLFNEPVLTSIIDTVTGKM